MEPKPRTVLVIEDDPDYARLLTAFLVRQGYQVRVASDAVQGQRMARLEQPDVITLDQQLPGAKGTSVCRRLRNSSHTAAIPVVILSGLIDPSLESEALACGADQVLSKLTLAASELVDAIESALQPRSGDDSLLFPSEAGAGNERTGSG